MRLKSVWWTNFDAPFSQFDGTLTEMLHYAALLCALLWACGRRSTWSIQWDDDAPPTAQLRYSFFIFFSLALGWSSSDRF